MACPAAQRFKLRNDSDWEPYRRLICELCRNGKTAHQVRQALKDLGFHVTPTQLRSRYIMWKLNDKNCRKAVATAAVAKVKARELLGRETVVTLDGKALDIQNQERYLKRNHLYDDVVSGRATTVATPPGLKCFTPPPLSRPLRSTVNLPEMILKNVDTYIQGSMDIGIWRHGFIQFHDQNSPSLVIFRKVHTYYSLASDLLNHGLEDKARLELALATKVLSKMNLTERPQILKQIFSVTFGLSRDSNPRLTATFLACLYTLGLDTLPTSHPLIEILRYLTLLQTLDRQFKDTVGAAWRCLSDCFKVDHPDDSWDYLSDRLDYIVKVEYHEDHSQAVEALRAVHQSNINVFGPHGLRVLECRTTLALALIEFGQYTSLDRCAEVSSLMRSVFHSLSHHYWTAESAQVCCTARFVLYVLHLGEGDMAAAEYQLWSAIQAVLPIFGWHNTEVQWYLMKIVHLLQLQGAHDVASEIKRGMSAANRLVIANQAM